MSQRELLTGISPIIGHLEWFGALEPVEVSRFSNTEILIEDDRLLKVGDTVFISGFGFPINGVKTIAAGRGGKMSVDLGSPHGLTEKRHISLAAWREWPVYDLQELSGEAFLRLRDIRVNQKDSIQKKASIRPIGLLGISAKAQPMVDLVVRVTELMESPEKELLYHWLTEHPATEEGGDAIPARPAKGLKPLIAALETSPLICLRGIGQELAINPDFEIPMDRVSALIATEVQRLHPDLKDLDVKDVESLTDEQDYIRKRKDADEEAFLKLSCEEIEILCGMPPGLIVFFAGFNDRFKTAIINLYNAMREIEEKPTQEKPPGKQSASKKPSKTT
jgi:hypothetical protein